MSATTIADIKRLATARLSRSQLYHKMSCSFHVVFDYIGFVGDVDLYSIWHDCEVRVRVKLEKIRLSNSRFTHAWVQGININICIVFSTKCLLVYLLRYTLDLKLFTGNL